MSKKFSVILLIFGSVVFLVFLGYFFYRNYYLPSTVTLPPPLANVEFPSKQTQYPADWPDELKYPSIFTLVDSSSGTLPESTAQGWAAKLRYQGGPSESTKAVSAFFEENGWTIVESNKLDSGGYSLIIQKEQASGIIVIDVDPNDSSQTLVIATIFL